MLHLIADSAAFFVLMLPQIADSAAFFILMLPLIADGSAPHPNLIMDDSMVN